MALKTCEKGKKHAEALSFKMYSELLIHISLYPQQEVHAANYPFRWDVQLYVAQHLQAQHHCNQNMFILIHHSLKQMLH